MHAEPPVGILNMFGDFWKKLTGSEAKKMQEQSQAAVAVMLPSLEEFLQGHSDCGQGQDIVKKIDQVCLCVKHVLYDDDYKGEDKCKLQQVKDIIIHAKHR